MRLRYVLEVIHGPQRGKSFALNRKQTVLGRGSACDIQLDDTEASRRHCQVTVSQSAVQLKDLGSANGVQVNGRMVDQIALNNGDVIRVGRTELRLVAQEDYGETEKTQAFAVTRRDSVLNRLHFLSWSVKILGVMLVAALISHALVAWPLIAEQRKTTADEALRKAGALVTALAALNQEALRLNDEMLLEVDSIAQHEGVLDVFVYDRFGRILAPVSRFHHVPTDEDSKRALGTDNRLMVERSKGVFDLAEPIRMYNVSTGRFDRIGTARIIFSLHTITSLEAGIKRSALISLVVLLLVAGVVARAVGYVTAGPITILRDDLEAVLKGDRSGLRETYRMGQLDKLAMSISRGLAKATSPQSQETSEKSRQTSTRLPAQTLSKFIADSVLHAVLLVDAQNNIVHANTPFQKMMGIDSVTLSGKHFFEAFPDRNILSGIAKMVQEALSDPDSSASGTINTDPANYEVNVAVHGHVQGSDEYDFMIIALAVMEQGG